MTSQPLLTTSPTQAQRDQRPDHRGAIARRKADIGGTSGDRVPSTVSAACVAAGPTNGESRTDGARHRDRNVEDDRNGGTECSSLRRPQWQASPPLPAEP